MSTLGLWNRLIDWLSINKNAPIKCGGTGRCDIVNDWGKVVGCVVYSRPDSAMKRSYMYDVQHGLATEPNLKLLDKEKNKDQKIHELVIRDLAIPYSEKIFIQAEGIMCGDGKDINTKPKHEQFEILKQYHDHILVQLVDVAYRVEGILKKKS